MNIDIDQTKKYEIEYRKELPTKGVSGLTKIYNSLGGEKDKPQSIIDRMAALKRIIPELGVVGGVVLDESPVSRTSDLDLAGLYIHKEKDAKRRGIEFSLSLSDLRKIVSRKTCFYTGSVLTEEGNNRPSLERLDNTKGYVKGNVVRCSKEINAIKNVLFEDPMRTTSVTVKGMLKFLTKLDELGHY